MIDTPETSANDPVSGVWWALVDFGGETGRRRMLLQANGNRLSGTVWGRKFDDGSIEGRDIQFQTADASRTYSWTATLTDNILTGRISYEGGGVAWTAQRPKPADAVDEGVDEAVDET